MGVEVGLVCSSRSVEYLNQCLSTACCGGEPGRSFVADGGKLKSDGQEMRNPGALAASDQLVSAWDLVNQRALSRRPSKSDATTARGPCSGGPSLRWRVEERRKRGKVRNPVRLCISRRTKSWQPSLNQSGLAALLHSAFPRPQHQSDHPSQSRTRVEVSFHCRLQTALYSSIRLSQ